MLPPVDLTMLKEPEMRPVDLMLSRELTGKRREFHFVAIFWNLLRRVECGCQ